MSSQIKKYCVYFLVNRTNNKTYIGMTDKLERRLEQHTKKAFSGKHRSNQFYYDMEMAEHKTFDVAFVQDNLTYSEALYLEYISVDIFRQSKEGCYNSVGGGKFPHKIVNMACFHDFQVFLHKKDLIPKEEITPDPYYYVSSKNRPTKLFLRDRETPETAMSREFKCHE